MSTMVNNIEHMDYSDFFLLAGCDSPVAVNMVKNKQTLGHLHHHDFHEMTVVIDGSCSYEYQGMTYSLSPGDTYITPAGELHHYYNQQNLVLMNFIWYPDKLPISQDKLYNIVGYRTFFNLEPQSRSIFNFKHRLVLPPEQIYTMQMYYHRIKNELQNQSNGFNLNIGLIFTELLITVSRFYHEKQKHKDENNNELQKLDKVLTFLNTNFMHEISRAKAAKIFGSSESTFSRSFKRIMSESFFNYLLNLRLQHARNMLLNSDKSMSDISSECGFCDSNYFCYRFRKKFEVSPYQFRLKNKNLN
jgi:AraC-like DNA-binding protein